MPGCTGWTRATPGWSARWRVLQLDVEGTGRQEGLKVRAVALQVVESIRPITNALPPAAAGSVPEEAGLFVDAPVVVGRGGQGDYAWEVRARKGSGQDFWIETAHQDGELYYGGLYQTPSRTEQQASLFCAPARERATAALVSGYPGTGRRRWPGSWSSWRPTGRGGPHLPPQAFPVHLLGARPDPAGRPAAGLHQLRRRRAAARPVHRLRRLSQRLPPVARVEKPSGR
jgi:hypothetical protein